jgi:hypothetical protein
MPRLTTYPELLAPITDKSVMWVDYTPDGGTTFESYKLEYEDLIQNLAISVPTLYSSDGTLNSNRNIDGNGKTLSYNGIKKYSVNVDSPSALEAPYQRYITGSVLTIEPFSEDRVSGITVHQMDQGGRQQFYGEVGSRTAYTSGSNFRALVSSGGKGFHVEQNGFVGNAFYSNVTTPAVASNYFSSVHTITGNHGGNITAINGTATGTDGNKVGVNGAGSGTTNAINYGGSFSSSGGFQNIGCYGYVSGSGIIGGFAVAGLASGVNNFGGSFTAVSGAYALITDGGVRMGSLPTSAAGLPSTALFRIDRGDGTSDIRYVN